MSAQGMGKPFRQRLREAAPPLRPVSAVSSDEEPQKLSNRLYPYSSSSHEVPWKSGGYPYTSLLFVEECTLF